MSPLQSMEVRAMTADDIEDVAKLLNSIFGEYALVRDRLAKWIVGEKYVHLIARDSGRLIAFCLGSTEPGRTEHFESFGADVMSFVTSGKIGMVHTLAVLPELRGRGIGQSLARQVVEGIRAKGCDAMAGVSWDNGSEQNSRVLYEKAGFKQVAVSDTFLNNQSKEQGFACTVCGPECRCRSYFYRLEV